MSVQLNLSAKEMPAAPAAAPSKPAANAQPKKAGGAQPNLGSEIVPFEPPLLDGCSFPIGVQEVVASFLPFSKESVLVYKPDGEKAKIAWHKPLESEVVAAQPGEVTIDALCKRTGEAFKTRIENICKLREESCDRLMLCPSLSDAKPDRMSLDEDPVYYISCGIGLSPENALSRCANPLFLQMWGVNYSNEELQRILQSKKVKVVEITGNEKASTIQLNLQDLEYLFVNATPCEKLDLRNCPRLRNLTVRMFAANSKPLEIDIRTVSGCRVVAETSDPITLLSSDATGKELTVQGTHNLSNGTVSMDFQAQVANKAEKKSDAPKS